MKKILAIVLTLVLIFSITACSNNNQDEETITDTKDDSVIEEVESSTNTTDDTQDTEKENDNTTKPTIDDEEEIPEMEYVMAKLYEDVNDQRSNLWFVVEFKHYDFGLDRSTPFVITNKITNEDITDLAQTRNSKYQMYVFTGNVCVNDHVKEGNSIGGISHTDDDAKQYVVQIWADGIKLSLDDLQIFANPYYNGGTLVEALEKQEFNFNSDMSAITTHQPYVHGTTLVEIGGKYYISDDNTGHTWGHENYGQGISVRFRFINGTPEELLAELESNTSFVYGNSAKHYLKEFSSEYNDDMYLTPVDTPENTKLWFSTSNKDIMIGFQSSNGQKFENEDYMSALSYSITPMYELEDGRKMIFIFE